MKDSTQKTVSENTTEITTPLRYNTTQNWLDCVLNDFDTFLQDHAAAEKKASGMALSMIAHYPDRKELVDAMADLAVEELNHYRDTIRWLHKRGKILAQDSKDEYVLAMRDQMRQGTAAYFLDRLVTGSIIEARGAERFGLVAKGIIEPELKRFYSAIARSESRHFNLFLNLAKIYFDDDEVEKRTDELLDFEAQLVSSLPIRPALH